MTLTVVEHVLWRLQQIGITDVFGVPGNYAFPINDAVCNDPKLRWVGSCNELNAAYAADGYARVKGAAALCTTYGVGELSAIAGISGSFAEHLPIFHLVGSPDTRKLSTHAFVHHSLGNHQFDAFHEMSKAVVCAHAVLTPENCAEETERLIAAAFYHLQPVYINLHENYAIQPVIGKANPHPVAKSDPVALEEVVKAIVEHLSKVKKACIMPGLLVARTKLFNEVLSLVNKTNLPFTTMCMDKTVLDESHPNYMGMYDHYLLNPEVRNYVESCECVLGVGIQLTEYQSGAFSAKIERAKTIDIMLHHVRVGHAIYQDVEMKDVLNALAERLPRWNDIAAPKAHRLSYKTANGSDKITSDVLYPLWEEFIREGDIVVTDVGMTLLGLVEAKLPKDVAFYNQALWEAIGWGTPAAFGAALAAPEKRVVLVTGDGAQQINVQEISQFYRYGLKPLIFLLNNDGYSIERILCIDPDSYYNDIAQWHYEMLPKAFGCEGWYVKRVTTCDELKAVLKEVAECKTGAYIEVVTDKYTMPPTAEKLHELAEAKSK